MSLNGLKKWQVAVLLVIVIGTAAGVYTVITRASGTSGSSSSSLPENTQLVPVQYGNVVNSVSASGSVVFPDKETLTFGIAGTVGAINVHEGDTVKEGQILAKLDSTSDIAVQIAVTQARINLENARDKLNEARNPDINQAKLAVANARIALKTAQEALEKAENPYTESDIAQAQLAVANARIALKTAQEALEKAENPYTESDIAQAQLAVANAKIALKTAQENYDKAKEKYESNWTVTEWILDYELKKAQLAIAQANLAKAEQTLTYMLAGADPSEVEQKRLQVAVAQDNLAKAEQTLTDMLAGADPSEVEQKRLQVAVAQDNLAKAEQTLAELEAGDSLELELLQLEVEKAQAALDETKKMGTIVAPFGGVVASINVKVGQAVNANTVAIELVNPAIVQVDAILSEIDVAQVKQGQRASVSLDALPDVKITGELTSIAVIGKSTSGVVSYPVSIRLAPPQGVQLREGMSATATIVIQQANNVLLIPNGAVGGTVSNPTVYVMVNGQLEERAVALGISDDTYTEVKTGLKEGDMVLVYTRSTSQRGLFGIGGGGMMGPVTIFQGR